MTAADLELFATEGRIAHGRGELGLLEESVVWHLLDRAMLPAPRGDRASLSAWDFAEGMGIDLERARDFLVGMVARGLLVTGDGTRFALPGC